MAIDDDDACGIQLAQAGADGDQIRVHQFDQRAAQEKVEADESQQRRRLVKHFAGGFLYLAALLDEIRS